MGRTTGRQRSTYSCRDHYLSIANPARHGDCRNCCRDLVDATVIGHIRNFLNNPSLLEEAARQHLRGEKSTSSHDDLERKRAEIRNELERESTALRRAGLRGAALAAALMPLQRELESVEQALRSEERHLRGPTRLQDQDVLNRAVVHARDALMSSSTQLWRPLLEALNTSITIASYEVCTSCEGSGYLAFQPGRKRGWPENCRDCLDGRNPKLEIAIDDVGALAVSRRVS